MQLRGAAPVLLLTLRLLPLFALVESSVPLRSTEDSTSAAKFVEDNGAAANACSVPLIRGFVALRPVRAFGAVEAHVCRRAGHQLRPCWRSHSSIRSHAMTLRHSRPTKILSNARPLQYRREGVAGKLRPWSPFAVQLPQLVSHLQLALCMRRCPRDFRQLAINQQRNSSYLRNNCLRIPSI